MKVRRATGLVLAALLGGCGGPNVNLQQLMSLPAPSGVGPQGPAETASVASPSGPHEASALVSGTPTDVFASVARGTLRCWFAADGPLKASHVYRAEARPPAKGGDAEIAVHERDNTVRDLRGPRAYRASFTAEGDNVRIVTVAVKFDLKVAQAMAKDVENWAKGGEECNLRVAMPPPAAASTAAKAGTKGQSASPAAKKAPPKGQSSASGKKL